MSPFYDVHAIMRCTDLPMHFMQAAMTPFVGSAGNALNRVILSAVGTVIWGVTSVGLGAARSFAQVNPRTGPESVSEVPKQHELWEDCAHLLLTKHWLLTS